MFSLLISSSSEFPNNKNNLVKMLMIINFELFSNSFLGKKNEASNQKQNVFNVIVISKYYCWPLEQSYLIVG